MNRNLISVCFALLLFSFGFSQNDRPLTKVMELPMAKEGGRNGAFVVHDKVKNLYYAAMAGNASFPFGVFDGNGKVIDTTLKCGADLRGGWLDGGGMGLMCNEYGGTRIIGYKMLENGVPFDTTIIFDDMELPEHSVGFYDDEKERVLFLEGNSVICVDDLFYLEDSSFKFELPGGRIFNGTSIITTKGMSNYYGLLNVDDKVVYLFDKTTLQEKGRLLFPPNAPVAERFNFSYANGIFWLFDMTARKWIGYK